MYDTLKNTYQLFEEIGRGRFGTILRAFCPTSAASVAVKIIDKTLLADETDRACIDKEPKIMSLLSPHPNILQIHNVFETEDSMAIVLDLCSPETLYDKIAHRTLSVSEAAGIMKQLLAAVSHCHRMGVVHRDLKPENVLFDSRNVLKLADFGSAEWFSGEGECMEGVVGTPYYVAPEVLMGRVYNEKVDVWSAGVMLYIMLGGIPPFYGETATEIFEAVLRGNLRFPPKVFRGVSPAAKDLLRKMMCRDVSRRLSAEQALRHPWILSGGESNPMD
ncbi:hypothetical protein ACLB2K_064750 [Fragaria x ananassa]